MARNIDILNLVPEQISGEKSEASATNVYENETIAVEAFTKIRDRLLNVNQWHQFAGFLSGVFQLTDERGQPAGDKAKQGCYIKIDIPGPGSNAGKGYDWVFIEQFGETLDEHVQSTGFRVRPNRNPQGGTAIAHFYSAESTSSFMVTRVGSAIDILIADRNLHPNDDTHSLVDTIRHTVAGMAAIGAFSRIQWQKLADGLINKI